MLERYEEVLRKRWIKKTGEQRRKVLLNVSPNMPATHRPDFEALRRESAEKPRSGTMFYDSFLLPSINQEDLMKPNMLLLFLESRGRHDPDVFANADFNSIHVANVAQAILPSYISGYTMLLIGQKSEAKYGRLLAWDEDDHAFDMMSTGAGIQPGEGLLTLEIQQRVMSFLRGCAEAILQDLPLHDTKIPIQPRPTSFSDTLKQSSNDSEWPSLTKEIIEAPYRVPDQYDVGRLQSFVSAKRAEAEDHVWFLREDPSYFKEVVFEWSEHRQEKILSINGKTHPVLRSDVFWDRVLSNVVVDAYSSVLVWEHLSNSVARLVELKERYVGHLSGHMEIPEDYENTLCHFAHSLEQITKGPLEHFKTGMVASPPLRNHYARQPQDPSNTKIIVTGKNSTGVNNDRFLWLMEQLLNEQQVFLFGLENLLDEIERIIRSDSKNRERVSPWIARLLSELSLLGELRRQMGLLKPGPPMTEALPVEAQNAEFARQTKSLSQVFNILTKEMSLSAAGTPLSKFDYPSEKRRTAATTKLMQQAEANLDAFCKVVDEHCIKNGGKSLHVLLAGVLPERELQRTPDWVEPNHNSKQEPSNMQDLTTQFSAAELERRTEETISPDQPLWRQPKIKTRGVSIESTTTTPAQPPSDNAAERIPKLTVSKRGFKVFSTLFHTDSESEPPGEIPWAEFLSAMASVGFSIKKLDGSAWVFEPQNALFRRSIIFHEPHPTSKLPFTVARRYGRRLERAYGWTGESFVRA